jgi:hypothetical protein
MKEKLIFTLFIVILGINSLSLYALEQCVDFDRLLPFTGYRQAYALCMRAWRGMRQFEESPVKEREHDMQDFHDCLLGRLVRMKATIKQLPNNPGSEQVGCFLLLLRHIEAEQKSYLQHEPLAQVALHKSQYHLLNLLREPVRER